VTGQPSKLSASLEAHARRLENRKLVQAFMDGEISDEFPPLCAALAADPQLRKEFEEMRRLGAMLQSPLPATDLSASILAKLQDRPVFLPSPKQSRRPFAGFGAALAASLAIGAGTVWLTLAALRAPAPLQSIAQADVLGEARDAIRNITGTSLAEQDGHRAYVIAPASESSQFPDVGSLVSAHDADPRLLASQMAGNGAVRIERSGLSFVNPGPDRAPSQSTRTRAAVLEWNTLPDAVYSGGKSRRSDVYRAAAASASDSPR